MSRSEGLAYSLDMTRGDADLKGMRGTTARVPATLSLTPWAPSRRSTANRRAAQ